VVDALVHSLIHHHHFWVHYVDPCLALLISVIIMASVIPSTLQSAQTLLQHIPEVIDTTKLQNELRKSVPEIADIHEFHIWRLEGNIIVATIHVVLMHVEDQALYEGIARRIREIFTKRKVVSLTLQPEFLPPHASSLALPAGGKPQHEIHSSNPSSSNSSDATVSNESANSPIECLFCCPTMECAGETCCGLRQCQNTAQPATSTNSSIDSCNGKAAFAIDVNTDECTDKSGDEEVLHSLLAEVTVEV